MGLSSEEIAALGPEALAIGAMIAAMFGADSDGGSKPTGAELKALGKALLKLGAKILVDVID